jgi:hypothetical protein
MSPGAGCWKVDRDLAAVDGLRPQVGTDHVDLALYVRRLEVVLDEFSALDVPESLAADLLADVQDFSRRALMRPVSPRTARSAS